MSKDRTIDNENWKLKLIVLKPLKLFYDGGPCLTETSQLVCICFCIVGTWVMEELNTFKVKHGHSCCT